MNSEKSSLLLCWILSVITSGLYSLYWLYSRTDVINRIAGNDNFQGKNMVYRILISFVIFSVLMGLALYFDPNQIRNKESDNSLFSIFLFLTFFAALFYIWSFIQAFYKAGYSIRAIELKRENSKLCSPALSWLLLFILYFNIPYLQSHINDLIAPVE
ncbi:DUF4234 domain-containing protein [Lutimonas sp.]|uniref:DUF4234 domain-containing protein n=1 Tax=Lutimonas sp. TaxID=1872403 RepID=UPI003D9AE5E6